MIKSLKETVVFTNQIRFNLIMFSFDYTKFNVDYKFPSKTSYTDKSTFTIYFFNFVQICVFLRLNVIFCDVCGS